MRLRALGDAGRLRVEFVDFKACRSPSCVRGRYCPGSYAGSSQQQPASGLVLLLSRVCSAAGAPIYSSWAPYLTKHKLAIVIPIIPAC